MKNNNCHSIYMKGKIEDLDKKYWKAKYATDL